MTQCLTGLWQDSTLVSKSYPPWNYRIPTIHFQVRAVSFREGKHVDRTEYGTYFWTNHGTVPVVFPKSVDLPKSTFIWEEQLLTARWRKIWGNVSWENFHPKPRFYSENSHPKMPPKTVVLSPIGSMGQLYIYLHEWLILMANSYVNIPYRSIYRSYWKHIEYCIHKKHRNCFYVLSSIGVYCILIIMA